LATGQKINTTAVCRQLGYSKQAYYKSVKNQQQKGCYEAEVVSKVVAIREFLPKLGGRKLYYLLKEKLLKPPFFIGRDRLFRILGKAGLLVVRKKKYAVTTDSRHWLRKYPDRIKGVIPTGPEQIFVADITYLEIENRFGYLHLLTDSYSKKIVGYQLSHTLNASHTIKALQMAIEQKKTTNTTIHHSDRGLQYCSAGYIQVLNSNKMDISMTQDGSPYDNAIAERVNGILKSEFGLDQKFDSMNQAKKATVRSYLSL
jgi:transposase InsO family protein